MGGQPDSKVDIDVRTTVVGQLIKCFAEETDDIILTNLMLGIGTIANGNAMLKNAIKAEATFLSKMDSVPTTNPSVSKTWMSLNAFFLEA